MPIPNKYYEDFVAELPSLEGKCIAITGTTSGTGFWCAMAAIQKGATALLLLNRASSRATAADADITLAAAETKTAVHSVVCDLMSFESVKKAASEAKGYPAATRTTTLCDRASKLTLARVPASAASRSGSTAVSTC